MTTMTNRFAGKCHKCGHRVEAEAGQAVGSRATGWKVQHHDGECSTAPVPAPASRGPLPRAEVGYYVREDGAAIQVCASKRTDESGKPYTFGKVFTPHPGKRPSWEYAKGAGISVADLRPMDASDAAQLGLSNGHCIFCCAPLGGTTESAQCAAIIGYGEICASHHGLPFPKGVAAQRACIATHGENQYENPTAPVRI